MSFIPHLRFKSLALLALLPLSLQAATPEDRPNQGPDLPQITVHCGKVTLLLRQASQWTLGRIDYNGVPMTTERSAYGTVFSFPEVGFIGTRHLENEPENLQSLSFFLDGEAIAEPTAELKGTSFRFVRESRIRGFLLTNMIELENDRLLETTTVRANEEIPLKLVYHFMHAWTPTVSAYLAGNDDANAPQFEGDLTDAPETARTFVINKPVDWMAVYEPGSSQFAVSRLLESPEVKSFSKIWNVPGVYRKYYLHCFPNQTVPAGFDGTWRMVTSFGKSSKPEWKSAAQQLSEDLRAKHYAFASAS